MEVNRVRLEAPAGSLEVELPEPLEVPGRFHDELGWAGLDLGPLGFEASRVDRLGDEATAAYVTGRNRVSGDAFGELRARIGEARGPLIESGTLPEPPPGVRLEGTSTEPVWVFSGPIRLARSVEVPPGVGTRFEPDLELSLAPGASLNLPENGSDPPPAGIRVGGSPTDPEWVFEGEVRLSTKLVLPEGMRARFAPGLRLTLDPGVDLVVRGDLISEGTPEAPIWVGAADVARPFGFLAVLGRSHRKAVVLMAHTTVQGGREGRHRASIVTGMLSIYDGHLQMRHSRILDARGEDGLNVKFGYVELYDNLFERTHSDAVDFDFCRGVARGNVFRDVLADGLDFSGSLVVAEDNTMEGLGDKGFSVGEETTILLRDNAVRRAVTGVAVKDSSVTELHQGPMEELRIGVAVYQKKLSFDSGKLTLVGPPPAEAVTPVLADPEADLHLVAAEPGPNPEP
ncbi:MAG: hypothetical protein MI919_42745 [Holophagales bacterium]|nr:hypothetical protein [Holophagales bacterium]